MNREMVYRVLAGKVQARLNCIEHENDTWTDNHTYAIEGIITDYFPSGSGIDNGVSLDYEKSTGERIVLHTSYHHMDEYGYYDGWTEHNIIITGSLIFGFNMRVTGRNRNDIKEYLTNLFSSALSAPYVERQ